MKVLFNPTTDTMIITFRDAPIRESDELRPGIIADLDADGEILRLEILDASKRVEDPLTVTLATTS